MSATINDDRILDARDMAEEIEAAKAEPRTFEDVANEWTETCLAENKKTNNTDSILLIMRLGVLGQRLIYEANAIGMRDVMKTTREVLELK